MNIVYILSATGISGGATKAFMTLLKGITEAGNTVTVVCPDKNGIYRYLTEENPMAHVTPISLHYTYDILPFIRHFKDIPLFIPRLIKRYIKNRLAANKLVRYCKKFNPDIIHTNTSVNNIGYIAAQKLHIPHIWHIREYGDRDFNMIVPNQKKKLRAHNNYKISITKDILNYKGLENDATARVIYDGPIEIIYNPLTADNRYFLYAGRLTQKKGVFDLIDAYRKYIEKVGSTAIPLKLAGSADTKVQARIRETIIGNNLQDLLIPLGNQPDLSELYKRATAVIVPSHNEGFGFVLPEAMSYGALTIGRNTGGTKEQYDNGVEITGNEIGFRFNNEDELVNILCQVSDSEKKAYMPIITNSQKVVNQLYTSKATVDNVLSFYNSIIKK